MDIGKLVSNQTGNGIKVALDTEKSKFQLDPEESAFLIAEADPYNGSSNDHTDNIKDANEYKFNKLKTSIKGELNAPSIQGQNFIFSAVSIALKNGLITIEDILGDRDLEFEMPRFKVYLRNLSRTQKRILAESYNLAVQHLVHTHGEIAISLQYTSSQALGSSLNGGRSSTVYDDLGISNNGQLAFLTHIYMHFMRNPIEEQLTGKQLDELEALVVRTNNNGDYNNSHGLNSNNPSQTVMRKIRQDLGVQSSMDAILKAFEMGFYSLLLGVDTLALVNLDPSDINFLKSMPDSVGNGRNYTNRKRIYGNLGINTMTQLAPYIFLATKLDEHEMDALRSTHASPDGDPMKVIYEKFEMPEHSALLAPSKYFAAKREMAVKN